MVPISFKDTTMCPSCGTHTLETYGNKNKIVDAGSDKERIYDFRCTKCGKKYIGFWDFDNEDFRAVDPEVFTKKFLDKWMKK